jgi:hypothetical protein
MKQVIRYNQPTQKAREKAAISDAWDWLSPKQRDALDSYAGQCIVFMRRNKGGTFTQRKQMIHTFAMACAMAGVQGLPVKALMRLYLTGAGLVKVNDRRHLRVVK